MVLSLRQGPLLAAIGLLASFATPLLIQTDTPSLLMLVVYLVLIGGAALALSRRTGWGWLATGTVFGWLGWSLMSIEAATSGQLILWSGFLALGFAVTVWFAGQYKTPEKLDLSRLDLQPLLAILWGALAALLVITVVSTAQDYQAGLPISAYLLSLFSIAALIATSWIFPKQFAHLVTAGTLAICALFMVELDMRVAILMVFIVAIVLLSFRNADKGPFNLQWAAFAVGLGLVSVAALDINDHASSADMVHASVALGFVGLFALASLWLRRRNADQTIVTVPVIGAGLGWALAAVLAFSNLPLSLAFSLGAAVAALVVWRVQMPGARLVLLGLAGLVLPMPYSISFRIRR
jgi:uncharacterized membrane protein